jgi:hypothetical protein
MEKEGSLGIQEALEVIKYAEASLQLAPGSEAPAWNLELTLRWVADSLATEALVPGSDPGQQVGEEPADTEEEELGEGESDQPRELGSGSTFTEEAARRLLASFRLMEREGTLGVIRTRLREGPNYTGLPRRGPPW